jgi:hypothetical protein
MLPELRKLCSVPKDKYLKVKGKAAVFLFIIFPCWFKYPKLSANSLVGHRRVNKTNSMSNDELAKLLYL